MTKTKIIEFCKQNLVALDDEIALLLRAIDQKISIIIKGESGTGKTELAKTIASALNRPFYRVDGDENLSITQLRGWFDPALAIQSGFGEKSFVPGPLTLAMLNGGLFFFNEVNRAPSESINGVLAAMDTDERILEIPQYKTITAKEEFYTIFTLNPLEYVGTNPLPEAFFDRCIQINLTHKSGEQATEIVKLRTNCTDQILIDRCVAFTEKTRTSNYFERGGSIRATIQLTQLLMKTSNHPDQVKQTINAVYSGKVKLHPDIDRSVEDCLSEIAYDIFFSELLKKKV